MFMFSLKKIACKGLKVFVAYDNMTSSKVVVNIGSMINVVDMVEEQG